MLDKTLASGRRQWMKEAVVCLRPMILNGVDAGERRHGNLKLKQGTGSKDIGRIKAHGRGGGVGSRGQMKRKREWSIEGDPLMFRVPQRRALS